ADGAARAARDRPFRGFRPGATWPVVRIPAAVRPLGDGRVDMASLQDRAVAGRAPAAAVGVRAGGDGRPLRLVVFAPGETSPRIQPEDRLPRAATRPGGAASNVPAELPRPREGVRRPDAAAKRACGNDEEAAQ